jgi:ABC-type glutathione transport system ATPase component
MVFDPPGIESGVRGASAVDNLLSGPSGKARPSGLAAVVVHDLWKTYQAKRDGESIHVLERIDLKVAAGEFVCIVGPSGCGKTTLLNIIGGFLEPTRGAVLVEGLAAISRDSGEAHTPTRIGPSRSRFASASRSPGHSASTSAQSFSAPA